MKGSAWERCSPSVPAAARSGSANLDERQVSEALRADGWLDGAEELVLQASMKGTEGHYNQNYGRRVPPLNDLDEGRRPGALRVMLGLGDLAGVVQPR